MEEGGRREDQRDGHMKRTGPEVAGFGGAGMRPRPRYTGSFWKLQRGKEACSPLEPQKEHSPADTLILAWETHFIPLTFGIVR